MLEDGMLQLKQSQVVQRSIQHTEYNLYFHGYIENPSDYMEHFAVYKQAGPNDVINLYLNSPGGSLSTTIEYVDHMRECEAPIVGFIGADCCSGASVVALQCDGWQLSEFSSMMVHEISSGAIGKNSENKRYLNFLDKQNDRFMRTIYAGFLSEEEIELCLDGKDLWLDYEELQERFENLNQIRGGSEGGQDEDEGIAIAQEVVKDSKRSKK
jgi:ATP-dependent protease ClpP protease subunit